MKQFGISLMLARGDIGYHELGALSLLDVGKVKFFHRSIDQMLGYSERNGKKLVILCM